MQTLKAELKIHALARPEEGVDSCQIIILAVKPDVVPALLKRISPQLNRTKLVISIAAGITLAQLQNWAGEGIPILRAMPNILVSFRKGVCALSPGKWADEAHLSTAKSLFEPLGLVLQVEEKDMDAVTALSGSGPAFVFTFIEALRDAGVRCGLARDLALNLATQPVLGAAHALLETGAHPALLRDKVTSPGGTTIRGLQALEAHGFRAAVMEALIAATARAAELSKAIQESAN
jgi:pyrroline-5-carboxylate reductase